MELSEIPSKLVLAFAASGGKNTIPVDSNPTPGGASYTDGFPPLTRTPISGGGIPPSGLDMNGALFEQSALVRWLNAGGTFPFDQDFADDVDVGGYPKGAILLQSDGNGVWFNRTDNNTTDPDDAGAADAGWVPGVRYGVTAVTMTSSNVTLTPLQYARPIIVITGTLTTNVQLIFPTVAAQWVVINATSGNYTITAKTASGAGIVTKGNRLLYSDGTDIKQATTDVVAASYDVCAAAGGTANAITAAFPNILPQAYLNGMPFYVRAASANTSTTPTVTFNSGTLTAKTIVKGANSPLAIGDIAGAGHWLALQYDSTLDKVVLLNPATWDTVGSVVGSVGESTGLVITTTGTNSNITFAATSCTLTNGAGQYATVGSVSTVKTTGSWASGTAAGGLDTGSISADTWYFIYVIYNGSLIDVLLSLSATAPTLPSGYDFYALVGAFRQGTTYPLSMVQRGRDSQYKVDSGSNVTALPTIISGVNGSTNSAFSVYETLEDFVPSIATKIKLLLSNPTSGSACMAAPNADYGSRASTSQMPPLLAFNAPESQVGEFVIESNAVWFAGDGANSRLQCMGWSI